ncbi:hypothetical protein ZIOFF_030092 [Zingiber officinale]|uniref:Uncharacterized protein n=1 Tax=Zingiber officinale TaxID=94328 RepID=A0A8J5GXM0_ZINOF|nr:hypothetical protein ZIOFF_030092 [Zingiber officinale]
MKRKEEYNRNAVKLSPCPRDCFIVNRLKLRALLEGLGGANNLNELCFLQTYELGEINNLRLAYRLEVTDGRGLKKISSLSSLRHLEVNDCPNLECVENLGKLQHLALTCSEETEQFPKWLRCFIVQHNNTASTHRSLRKFEMQCNILQLLKSCLGNENWDIIKQIPNVLGAETHLLTDGIRRAFEARVSKPPLYGYDQEALNGRRQILQAPYGTLSDPSSRGDYNLGLVQDPDSTIIAYVPWDKVFSYTKDMPFAQKLEGILVPKGVLQEKTMVTLVYSLLSLLVMLVFTILFRNITV